MNRKNIDYYENIYFRIEKKFFENNANFYFITNNYQSEKMIKIIITTPEISQASSHSIEHCIMNGLFKEGYKSNVTARTFCNRVEYKISEVDFIPPSVLLAIYELIFNPDFYKDNKIFEEEIYKSSSSNIVPGRVYNEMYFKLKNPIIKDIKKTISKICFNDESILIGGKPNDFLKLNNDILIKDHSKTYVGENVSIVIQNILSNDVISSFTNKISTMKKNLNQIKKKKSYIKNTGELDKEENLKEFLHNNMVQDFHIITKIIKIPTPENFIEEVKVFKLFEIIKRTLANTKLKYYSPYIIEQPTAKFYFFVIKLYFVPANLLSDINKYLELFVKQLKRDFYRIYNEPFIENVYWKYLSKNAFTDIMLSNVILNDLSVKNYFTKNKSSGKINLQILDGWNFNSYRSFASEKIKDNNFEFESIKFGKDYIKKRRNSKNIICTEISLNKFSLWEISLIPIVEYIFLNEFCKKKLKEADYFKIEMKEKEGGFFLEIYYNLNYLKINDIGFLKEEEVNELTESYIINYNNKNLLPSISLNKMNMIRWLASNFSQKAKIDSHMYGFDFIRIINYLSKNDMLNKAIFSLYKLISNLVKSDLLKSKEIEYQKLRNNRNPFYIFQNIDHYGIVSGYYGLDLCLCFYNEVKAQLCTDLDLTRINNIISQKMKVNCNSSYQDVSFHYGGFFVFFNNVFLNTELEIFTNKMKTEVSKCLQNYFSKNAGRRGLYENEVNSIVCKSLVYGEEKRVLKLLKNKNVYYIPERIYLDFNTESRS